MTITLPLTRDEEARLMAIAESRGISADMLIRVAVQEVLASSDVPAGETVEGEELEKSLETLFAGFDSLDVPAGVREEAFHRDNWYR